jgi:hypothetical protein
MIMAICLVWLVDLGRMLRRGLRMTAADEGLDLYAGVSGDESTLRLVWPQWQGCWHLQCAESGRGIPF